VFEISILHAVVLTIRCFFPVGVFVFDHNGTYFACGSPEGKVQVYVVKKLLEFVGVGVEDLKKKKEKEAESERDMGYRKRKGSKTSPNPPSPSTLKMQNLFASPFDVGKAEPEASPPPISPLRRSSTVRRNTLAGERMSHRLPCVDVMHHYWQACVGEGNAMAFISITAGSNKEIIIALTIPED
jgi:hypothetical protein